MSDPVNGTVWLVRFANTRNGETVTRVYRQRPAALRYMEAVEDAGGHPALYWSRVDWTPASEE